MTNYERIQTLRINQMAEFLAKDIEICTDGHCDSFDSQPRQCERCKKYKARFKKFKKWLMIEDKI